MYIVRGINIFNALQDEGILKQEEFNDMQSEYHGILSENLKLTESYKIQVNYYFYIYIKYPS